MADSLAQPRRKGGRLEDQAWRAIQGMPPVPESYSTMRKSVEASYRAGWPTSTQFQYLPEASISMGEAPVWNGLQSEPCIMPNSEPDNLQNGDINCSGIVAGHDSLEKSNFPYGSGYVWQPVGTNDLPHHGYSFDGSDMDTTASSSSPRSYFSEPSAHYEFFKTDTVGSSSTESWIDNEAQSCELFHSVHEYEGSSNFVALNSSVVHPSLLVSSFEIPGSQSDGFASSFVPPYTVPDSTDIPCRFLSDPSYPFMGNSSQWYTPSSSGQHYPQIQAQQQLDNSHGHRGNKTLATYSTPRRQFDELVHSTASMGMPLDTQMPLSTGAQAQRADEDKILLEEKQKGSTYKEIRKKMRTLVAESTLRGRYRSLTKERKDRVRKPIWTPKDIRLLKEIVFSEFRVLDDSNYRTLTRSQKLSKISWKRVAEYIALGGGSYHFGNSTCKKKWSEIDVHR